MTDKPIHFFDRGKGGRGLCGTYLSRGWLDATEDPAAVTCDDCRAKLDEREEDPAK